MHTGGWSFWISERQIKHIPRDKRGAPKNEKSSVFMKLYRPLQLIKKGTRHFFGLRARS